MVLKKNKIQVAGMLFNIAPESSPVVDIIHEMLTFAQFEEDMLLSAWEIFFSSDLNSRICSKSDFIHLNRSLYDNDVIVIGTLTSRISRDFTANHLTIS